MALPRFRPVCPKIPFFCPAVDTPRGLFRRRDWQIGEIAHEDQSQRALGIDLRCRALGSRRTIAGDAAVRAKAPPLSRRVPIGKPASQIASQQALRPAQIHADGVESRRDRKADGKWPMRAAPGRMPTGRQRRRADARPRAARRQRQGDVAAMSAKANTSCRPRPTIADARLSRGRRSPPTSSTTSTAPCSEADPRGHADGCTGTRPARRDRRRPSQRQSSLGQDLADRQDLHRLRHAADVASAARMFMA